MNQLVAGLCLTTTSVAVCLGGTQARAVVNGQHGPTADSPRTVWRTPIPSRGIPAVDNLSVYALTEGGELIAVQAETGTLRWRTKVDDSTGGTWGSRTAILDDVVVAGAFDVVAVERLTGLVRWRFSPDDGYGAGIYLGDEAGGLIFCGSPSGRLYAIDSRSGRLRWSRTVNTAQRTTVFWPRTAHGIVVAGYTTFDATQVGGLIAVELSSGRELWRRPFPAARSGVNVATSYAGGPVGVDGLILAASATGDIFGLKRRNGFIQWSIRWTPRKDLPFDQSNLVEFRALGAKRGTLFASSINSGLIAYDVRTRAERWAYFDRRDGSSGFQILVDEERVYVSYIGGGIVALRSSDGTVVWRTDPSLKGLAWPPALAGKRIYAASSLGLLALEE